MAPSHDDEFVRLVAEFPPRVVRSPDDQKAVEARISDLLAAHQLSAAELRYLDVISELLWAWEERNEPIVGGGASVVVDSSPIASSPKVLHWFDCFGKSKDMVQR